MPVEELEQIEALESAELEPIDTSEADAPDTPTLGDEDEDADLESPDAEDEPVEGEEVAEVVGDGRRMPDSLKKALSGLKAENPAAVKEIKGLFFANQEYREVFPKPADAVAAKALIEQFGGPEGVEALTAERGEWEAIDKGFAEGSADFVKSIADNNPEGFLKTAPNVINEFAQRAPEQYGFYRDSVSYNTIMQQPGVESALADLSELYGRLGGYPAEQKAIASVVNGIVGLRDRAQEFQSKRPDPREEQLRQRETNFETQRRADFEGKVADDAEKYLGDKMQPEIDRVINGRNVSAETMSLFHRLVKEEVEKKLGAVPGLERDLESHYRTGDSKRSLAYITSKYNAILPNAVKVIEPYLRDINPGRKPAVVQGGKPAANGARPASGPGEITLKEMPDQSQIDFSKCTVADVMMGKAVLKNGKRASGWM